MSMKKRSRSSCRGNIPDHVPERPTGLFRTGIDSGLLLDANDCLARFLGYRDRKELLATPFNMTERYADPRERQRIISLLREQAEFHISTRGSSARTVPSPGCAIHPSLSPRKAGSRGIAEDITKEKALEESLRESEERYRSILKRLSRHHRDHGQWRAASSWLPGGIDPARFRSGRGIAGPSAHDFLPPNDRSAPRPTWRLCSRGSIRARESIRRSGRMAA